MTGTGRQRPLREPSSPRIGTNLTPAHALESDGVHHDVEYLNTDLSGLDLEVVEIDSARLSRTNLAASRFQRLSITNSVIEGCDLANVNAAESSLIRSEVSDGRLTGFTWTGGHCRDTKFLRCQMKLASFRFSRFKPQVVFSECDLASANFQNADLTGVRFVKCDLTGAQFSNAKMPGTRFADCALLNIVGVTSFDGAIVESSDIYALAHSLAGALGITIE